VRSGRPAGDGPIASTRPYGPEIDAMERLIPGAALIPLPASVSPVMLNDTTPKPRDTTTWSELARLLTALVKRVEADHGRLLEDQARLIEERDRLQDQLQKALAEADHAKADQVHMARDVAVMFDELKALADRHAELHTDRARLEAELERARRVGKSAAAMMATVQSVV
jgi:septal ring factor EnvC (AmiA/AmiB activator)